MAITEELAKFFTIASAYLPHKASGVHVRHEGWAQRRARGPTPHSLVDQGDGESVEGLKEDERDGERA